VVTVSGAARRVRRRALPPDWAPEAGLHPVLARVFAMRGAAANARDLALGRLLPPVGMRGIDAAAALLAQAIVDDARILIVGDYDADGATGTAVALRGLRLLGAKHLDYRVPNRFTHGYGLTPALVAEIAVDAPDLLITVDSGINCVAGVAAARAAGMRVLITDHHLPGAVLPDADAIVDPNVEGDAFPSKALAGVGVMFYLLAAVRAELRARGACQTLTPDLTTLLDLVALGTVADLVPLDHNNRVLVAAGLRRIRAGRACPGIAALLEVSKRNAETVQASDLGFAIGPRINAAGRLEDMSLGIACLLADDLDDARRMASELHAINAQRRELQTEMSESAQAIVAGLALGGETVPPALALFDSGWHAGVVGLVASRVKDQWHRPTIAFASASDGDDSLKGSGRSIDGFHLRDALADIAARHPGLIERFGGHAMAAGLSLQRTAFDAFATAFAQRARELLGDAPQLGIDWSDGELDGGDAALPLAELLIAAGPWGQAFPEPRFDGEFIVRDWRVMAERHLRLTLAFVRCGTPVEAVYFGGYAGSAPPTRVHALYRLGLDEWRGERRCRLFIEQWNGA
jgi:single-stranded-DNA-specific exonuclease